MEGHQGRSCAVLPPFHHADQLAQIKSDPAVVRQFSNGKTNLLMVGRLAPNKAHSALIDTFFIYHYRYNRDSRLLIVGKEDPGFVSYNRSLKIKVEKFALENSIFFLGQVKDEALKAYYLLAHAFIMTSLHEGFCVPLIEAMSMRVPIVAYGSTAIPETVGKVGFVWNEWDPELIAASIDRIVRDGSLRRSLSEMGWMRYQSMFTNHRIKEKLFELLRKANLIE